MLHNILQIKMTKLSEVIKIIAFNPISVLYHFLYIFINYFPKIIINPLRIESRCHSHGDIDFLVS